ncbi:family 92 glycosyl hydrolase [Calycina marina]|uniref:Family 92 glycosyl hydrolase n=1 Tax=Calycina marina TaxID=1763456 RepID=A0A9P8CJ82_9HELO|nr:family 92 glycosyl hydrolase [Calycina marina]
MPLCKGFTQGGSNADIVLADAFVKGLIEGTDWATGFKAVVKNAEVQPLDWNVAGRGVLTSWKSLGYIPTDDFHPYGGVISLGHTEDAAKYLQRSDNWKNMYKASQVSLVSNTTGHPNTNIDSGFAGFLQVRFLNNTFGFQDPSFCSPLYNFTSCYLNAKSHETYEGSSWMYTFFVLQDMSTLVTTLGAPDTFVKRLSYLHTSCLLSTSQASSTQHATVYQETMTLAQ